MPGTTGRRSGVAGMTGHPLPPPAGAATRRIAVIGAGMAGLAAARALCDAGADLHVYEARDRIGGRVWTSRLWPDQPADMGASWIHGVKRNPLTKMAKKAKVALSPFDYGHTAAFAKGARQPKPAKPWKLLEKAQDRALAAAADMALRDAVQALPKWRRWSSARQADFHAAVHRMVEHEYAADWADLSAQAYDDGSEFRGGDALIPGGYDQLVLHAARSAKSGRALPIQLGAQVTRISLRVGKVSVTLANGQTDDFDTVLVTLPLGVLQSGGVRFDPPLAPSRQAAIDSLGMGLLNKIWLRFDAALPLPDVDWIVNLGPPHDLWPEWVNAAPATGQPLLLAFNAGPRADEVEALDDAATTASAVDALRAMFGSSFPAPVAAQITRWRADPFALGAYSYQPPGTSLATRRALAGADWDGRLAFAGEATSDHASTVHGAWLSGLKAARALASAAAKG